MVNMSNEGRQSQQSEINICVVTHPFDDLAGKTILENFIRVLESVGNEIFIITGNFSYKSKFDKKIDIMSLKNIYKERTIIGWAIKQVITQILVSINILRNYKHIDVVIFFLGGRTYALPVLLTRILGKKIIVTATGSAVGTTSRMYKVVFGTASVFISIIAGILEKICFSLSNQIFVESESAINFLRLYKYKNKISINGAMYVDTNVFKIIKDLNSRKNLIGYIGRLSEEKGILNFINAIPFILNERDDIKFMIVGGGLLFDKIEGELRMEKYRGKVTLVGWVSHEKIPEYLNELKLLILPSYTEGVPGIVQEAMACGTPVLATPVGGIPDLIRDKETGFILENNKPEYIATKALSSLQDQNLEKIANKAREYIESEYSYEAMVRKCKNSLLS
jgi:glycosyltransferase involved in cell wall biosynthesis